jgi:hypothetical protein
LKANVLRMELVFRHINPNTMFFACRRGVLKLFLFYSCFSFRYFAYLEYLTGLLRSRTTSPRFCVTRSNMCRTRRSALALCVMDLKTKCSSRARLSRAFRRRSENYSSVSMSFTFSFIRFFIHPHADSRISSHYDQLLSTIHSTTTRKNSTLLPRDRFRKRKSF